jgi:NAD(P)-dependent dehydrogenase (short-subunit alcohol dehydrogenase family)
LRFGSILTVAERDWDLVLTVNLKSPVFLMKAVANHMIERNGRGAIINIASIDGLVAEYGSIPYSASKAGMIHATKCAAVELAPYRINVNAIAPGTIKTELVKEQLTEKRVEALKRRVPWPEVGTPEDISGIAVFLASPLAGYVTGAVVVADGGWTVDGTAR